MVRRLVSLALLLLVPGLAPAQITWQFDFQDPAGVGFNSPVVPPGETLTIGQLRRNSLTAATAYLNTVLDGRGTVNLTVVPSITAAGDPTLGFFGPGQFADVAGSFQNGGVYQAARTNALPFAGPAGSGGFNFAADTPWNYAGQQAPLSPTAFDLTTVAAHELTHSAGFLSALTATGGSQLGARAYTGFDQSLQTGAGDPAAGRLFDTARGSPTYGAFVGPAGTLTSGTSYFADPPVPVTTNLYFGGAYTREAFGGPVPIYAPNPYEGGSSHSHVIDAAALMDPVIDVGQVKRLRSYERAMLLDLGWNTFTWNGTTGNWGDGVAGTALDVAASRWRSDQGIVSDGTATYNNPASPAAAPVLPPTGATTGDLALNFGGGGYTATNDLGTVRAARLNLSPTGPVTLAGGTLAFGRNSDGTDTLLAPQIVQSGGGDVTVTTAVSIAAGSNPAVPRPLSVTGTGAGGVTLAGGVSGTGGLQKYGPFVLTVAGPTTYTGPTEVMSGTLRLTGAGGLATSPSVTVGAVTGTTATLDVSAVPGGHTLAAGQTLRGAGAVVGPLAVGPGTLQGGNATAASGTLSVTAGTVTVTTGSTVRAAVGGSGVSTRVAVAGAFDRAAGGVFTLALQPDGLTLADFTPVVGPWTVLTYGSTNLPPGVYTSASSGAPFTVTLTTGQPLFDWTATVGSGSLVVNSFTPVPEPAAGLLAATVGVWVWRGRRQRSKSAFTASATARAPAAFG